MSRSRSKAIFSLSAARRRAAKQGGNKMLRKCLLLAGSLAAVLCSSAPSIGLEDATRAPFQKAFKGKKVAFFPITMSIDITQTWAAEIKKSLEPLGVEFVIRDGNFDIDKTAQAMTNLIDQGVNVLVVQNNDYQAYVRLYKQAQAAGVYVVQIGMQSALQTDAYAGPDWTTLGEMMGKTAIAKCGAKAGKSGKIALVQGAVTSANGIFITQGIQKAIEADPSIKIVANQGTDWDPSKAHAIASTTLQQNPDLCAFLGYYDDQDLGIVAALKEAGKTGSVLLLTSGIGEQKNCNRIASSEYDIYYTYDPRTTGRQAADTISFLLQAHPAAGSMKALQITPLTETTKEAFKPQSCWAVNDIVGAAAK
jgi:ribose transport system substrate-binding protein